MAFHDTINSRPVAPPVFIPGLPLFLEPSAVLLREAESFDARFAGH